MRAEPWPEAVLASIRVSWAERPEEFSYDAGRWLATIDGERDALARIFSAFDKSGNVPMFLADVIREERQRRP